VEAGNLLITPHHQTDRRRDLLDVHAKIGSPVAVDLDA